MKIAIMSDIHGNADALEKVLADAEREGVSRVLCCGDMVGYGPEPARVIALLRAHGVKCVMGNHDAAVAGVRGTEHMVEEAFNGVQRDRVRLDEGARDWLRSLPYEATCGGVAIAHGSFDEPETFQYVMDTRDADRCFYARSERMLFIGHTHLPCAYAYTPSRTLLAGPRDFMANPDLNYLINVGSVGCPRDVALSSYVIFDEDTGIVQFRRLPFDLDGYRRTLVRVGQPIPGWVDRLGNA